jgi:hypothetical protein
MLMVELRRAAEAGSRGKAELVAFAAPLLWSTFVISSRWRLDSTRLPSVSTAIALEWL